jgi:hypothetical protein
MAIEDRNRISRAKPQHTRKMLRFVVWQLDLS